MGLFGLNRKEKNIWKNIKPGDKTQIFLKKVERKTFETKVLDVNDTNLYIQTPAIGQAYLELPRKTKVEIEIEMHTPESGKAKFTSRVRGQEWFKENAIKIIQPKKIKWVNLRRKYRVSVSLPTEFSFVDKDKIIGDLQIERPVYQAEIRNISEGGALIIVDKLTFVKVGDFMNIKIHLTPENLWRARAKIVHIELAQAKYGLGIEWVSLKNNQFAALKDFVTPLIEA